MGKDNNGVWGIGELDPATPSLANYRPKGIVDERQVRKYGTGATPVRKGKRKPKKSDRPKPELFGERDESSVDDQRSHKRETLVDTNPEDREKAREILDDIGRRFAENRRRGKSTAFEEYQQDIANNLNYLVMGGVMNLKESSVLLMQLEDLRKQTSDNNETVPERLSRWLRGELSEDGLDS